MRNLALSAVLMLSVCAGDHAWSQTLYGSLDCMKLWQSLNAPVVALMGCSLSEHQERLLLHQFKRITLTPRRRCDRWQAFRGDCW